MHHINHTSINRHIYWFDNLVFSVERNKQVKVALYQIRYSCQNQIAVIFPKKFRNFFDFQIFLGVQGRSESCEILFIKHLSLDLDTLKIYYNFHKFFFWDLKLESFHHIEKDVLKFDSLFENSEDLIPKALILPFDPQSKCIYRYTIDSYLFTRISNNFKNTEINTGDIVQSTSDSKTLYKII